MEPQCQGLHLCLVFFGGPNPCNYKTPREGGLCDTAPWRIFLSAWLKEDVSINLKAKEECFKCEVEYRETVTWRSNPTKLKTRLIYSAVPCGLLTATCQEFGAPIFKISWISLKAELHVLLLGWESILFFVLSVKALEIKRRICLYSRDLRHLDTSGSEKWRWMWVE